jgi:hypothetical protein
MAKATKVVSDNTILKAQAIVCAADGLVEKRQDWQQNEYARSNARLYEILAEVLKMYEQVKDDKQLRTETVKQMRSVLTAAGVRIQTNTLAVTLFVRYVFRTDRQRALNYSRTIQAALSQGIKAEDFAQFVEGSGGVGQCKREFAKSDKVKAKEQAINDAMTLVEEQLVSSEATPLATFKVSPEFVADKQEGYVFVMAKAGSKGEVKALAVVPAQSASVTNWAKQQLAQFLSTQAAQSATKARSDRKDQALEAAKQASKNKTPTAMETVGDLIDA